MNGKYQYTSDLAQLSATSSPSPIQHWPRYRSPIRLDELAPFLARHPDQTFATFIHGGLSAGFRIGFTNDRANLTALGRNHPSALANEAVIDDRIRAELAEGRLLGPIPPHLLPLVHVSPLGLVPKAHQVNRWHMICDLSSPRGSSTNDGIPSDLCSLQYATVDDAVHIIQQLGSWSN